MPGCKILELDLYEEISDTELAEADLGNVEEMPDTPSYAEATGRGTLTDGNYYNDEDDCENDTNNADAFYTEVHSNSCFLSNLKQEHFHPLNITRDWPCTAFVQVLQEYSSKYIFDSLRGDGMSVSAIRCLQREPSGDVLITFSDLEHCFRFFDLSSLIIYRSRYRYTTHLVSGLLTFLTTHFTRCQTLPSYDDYNHTVKYTYHLRENYKATPMFIMAYGITAF